jgi:hypothetical protein
MSCDLSFRLLTRPIRLVSTFLMSWAYAFLSLRICSMNPSSSVGIPAASGNTKSDVLPFIGRASTKSPKVLFCITWFLNLNLNPCLTISFDAVSISASTLRMKDQSLSVLAICIMKSLGSFIALQNFSDSRNSSPNTSKSNCWGLSDCFFDLDDLEDFLFAMRASVSQCDSHAGLDEVLTSICVAATIAVLTNSASPKPSTFEAISTE